MWCGLPIPLSLWRACEGVFFTFRSIFSLSLLFSFHGVVNVDAFQERKGRNCRRVHLFRVLCFIGAATVCAHWFVSPTTFSPFLSAMCSLPLLQCDVYPPTVMFLNRVVLHLWRALQTEMCCIFSVCVFFLSLFFSFSLCGFWFLFVFSGSEECREGRLRRFASPCFPFLYFFRSMGRFTLWV